MTAPLAGLRVLELARILAGPWIGQTLADLGADVVKVEAPEGDDTRREAPGGLIPSIRTPIVFSDADLALQRPSPRLGEHTAEVMHEVGMSPGKP
jgi:crotonobetainyl-CoA:carnitine CoA-transferase CaiB-like acyl-CoA transferase